MCWLCLCNVYYVFTGCVFIVSFISVHTFLIVKFKYIFMHDKLKLIYKVMLERSPMRKYISGGI